MDCVVNVDLQIYIQPEGETVSCSDTSSQCYTLGPRLVLKLKKKAWEAAASIDHAELCQEMQGHNTFCSSWNRSWLVFQCPVFFTAFGWFVRGATQTQPGCFNDSAKLPLELCTGKVPIQGSFVHVWSHSSSWVARFHQRGCFFYSKARKLETRICLIGSCCDYDLWRESQDFSGQKLPLTFDAQLGVSNFLVPFFSVFQWFSLPSGRNLNRKQSLKTPQQLGFIVLEEHRVRGAWIWSHGALSCERDSSSSTWRWWFPNLLKISFLQKAPQFKVSAVSLQGSHQFPSFPHRKWRMAAVSACPASAIWPAGKGMSGSSRMLKSNKGGLGYTFTIIPVRK